MKKTSKRKAQSIKCGDMIKIKKSHNNDYLKCYSMHDQHMVTDLSDEKKLALVLDDEPITEMNKSGKLKIFVDNKILYLHHSDFDKLI
tara:strand:- start:3727 stop:3990 length:264 start_codon:yes stop_codon:yes gene_type:complete